MMTGILQTIADYSQTLENVFLSSLCGIGIYLVFYVTYKKVSVSRSFAYTLVLLPHVSCMIAIIVNNDIVLAAGMLGSLSIIRFRHSMKESKNLVFVFWAVTAGIICGLSFRRIALLWCCIMAVLTLAIYFLANQKRFGTLAVRTSSGTEEIEKIFNEFSVAYAIKYKNVDETYDILYEFRHKKSIDNGSIQTICERIMLIEGVSSVRFIEM